MVATGVSIFMSPCLAVSPATNVMVPDTRLIKVELLDPLGSYTISLSTILACDNRPNTVPSMKVMPSVESEPVWTLSPFSTSSPMLRMMETPLRTTVALPAILVTWPITLPMAAPPSA